MFVFVIFYALLINTLTGNEMSDASSVFPRVQQTSRSTTVGSKCNIKNGSIAATIQSDTHPSMASSIFFFLSSISSGVSMPAGTDEKPPGVISPLKHTKMRYSA